MGCDIHLRLEKRLKKEKVWNEYYTEKCEWQNCHIIPFGKTWGDRIYGMFAALANVCNRWDIEHIPIRGLEIKDAYEDENFFLTSEAEDWVKDGFSRYYEVRGRKYCSNPDYHSANWCTTQEMEDCISKVFKDEKGNFSPTAEPYEWLALLGAMKGYESTGEYECRAVFWFDN